jgi:hypothetical protein
MQVKALNLRDGTNSFNIKGLENGLTKDFTVTLAMVMTVAVKNSNRYHMKVDSINVNAFILANITQLNLGTGARVLQGGGTQAGARRKFVAADSQVLIGTGQQIDPIKFPVDKEITFNMNLDIIYKPDQAVELGDDVMLNEILQSCGVIQPGPREMIVKYTADAPIKLLRPIGFIPQFSGELKINCPFPPDQLKVLVDSLRESVGGTQGTPVFTPGTAPTTPTNSRASSLRSAGTSKAAVGTGQWEVIPGLFSIPM